LDKLAHCDKGQGYAVLFLRDEIAQEYYPLQCGDRDHFMKKLWPDVVHEIRLDNRILKRKETIQGKGELDWWEWVAEVSRKKRAGGAE
jgi:hypothetical protein